MVLIGLLVRLLVPADAWADDGRPVVFLHGFASRTDIWRGAEIAAQAAGFDPILVPWAPGELRSARETATEVLLPSIEAALEAHGYPPGASFDVVAHSMSGLLMRYLIEQARPELALRIGSLVMISTPHRGTRTGIANWACAVWGDPGWRALGCELRPTSDLLTGLGAARPGGIATRYLSIGVESFTPMIPVPPYDANGDGVALGHDKAVMAESAMLDGAPFLVWRAWGRRGDHFGVTCSAEVTQWALQFVASGTVPEAAPERVRATNLCAGMPKRPWREARRRVSRGSGMGDDRP
jgi:pimeloyl-ACP methyl ester carboxylesterase